MRSGRASLLALDVHEALAERRLRRVLIVRAASQSDAVDRRLATARELAHMIELEITTRLAPPAALADERALLAVPFHDGALHRGWNVPAVALQSA
jgi:hypothetical protein